MNADDQLFATPPSYSPIAQWLQDNEVTVQLAPNDDNCYEAYIGSINDVTADVAANGDISEVYVTADTPRDAVDLLASRNGWPLPPAGEVL